MAITVEELEILVSVQKEKAVKDLEEIRKKLEDMMSKAMPSIQKAAQQAQQAVQSITPGIKTAAEQVKVATDSMTGGYAKANREIEKQQKLLNALIEKRKIAENSIRGAFTQNLSEKASVQAEPQVKSVLASDPQIKGLDTQIAEASKQLNLLKSNFESSTAAAKQAGQHMSQSVKAMESAISAGMPKIVAQYQILSKQMDLQREKIAKLRAALEAGIDIDKTYSQLRAAVIQLDKMGLSAEKLKGKMQKPTEEVKRLNKEIRSTTQKGKTAFEKLGATIVRVFKFAVAYKALRALFTFISDGIKSAIDAPEIENMFRVAFGAGADEAARFAESMQKAFGIDTYATKQMLGTFQNMSTAMGIGTKNAAEMSKGLTLLANDMASLYNVDPQQAAENLQSALSGQGRAVRKYGYIILDSTIKETAYRLGIAETGAELTEQQKVLARYMTLQEQSKNAQGDLARTIQNVANQLRILKQNIVAAGRSIGTAFIPFIQAATPFLNGFFILLQRIGTALSTFTFGLLGMNFAEWKKEQEAIVGGTGDMSQAEDEYADSVDKAAKAQKGLLSGFDKLNISQRKAEGTGIVGGEGGFDIPEIEAPTGESPFEKMADAMQASFEKIKKTFEPFITNVGNSLKWFYDNVLLPIKNYTVNNLVPAFFEALAAVLNSPVWVTVGEQLANIYGSFLKPVATWAGEKVIEMFSWIKDNGDAVATTVVAIGTAFLTWKTILLLEKAAGIITVIGKTLKGLSLAKLGTALATKLPALSGLFTTIGTAISGAIGALATFLGVSVGWAVAIVAAVVAAVAAVILNWDKIVIFFTKTIPEWWENTVMPFFANMGQGLLEGVDNAVAWIIDAWNRFMVFMENLPENIGIIIGKIARHIYDFATKTVPEFFGKAYENIKKWGADVRNFLSVEVPNWIASVAQWFSELPGKIWEWLVSAYEKVKQWGIDLVNWAQMEIPQFIDTVINFFKELPGKVWDIGVELVKSLGGGMQSMIDWIGDKVSNFIGDIVDGFNEGFSNSNVDVNVKQKRLNMPRLAGGGVLTAPRIVMAGEYPGARTNPEIVTPQSLMYETSLKAQQAANQPVIAIMSQVLQAIKDGKIIELDGYEVGRQLDQVRNNNNLLLGI